MLRWSHTTSQRIQQNPPKLAKLLDGAFIFMKAICIFIQNSLKNVSDIISMFMNLFALLLSNKFVVTMATATSQAKFYFCNNMSTLLKATFMLKLYILKF